MSIGINAISSGSLASRLLIYSQVRFVDDLASRHQLSDSTLQKIKSFTTPFALSSPKKTAGSSNPVELQVNQIDSALLAMSKIEKVLEQAYNSSTQALSTDDTTIRASAQEELKEHQTGFDNILKELDQMKSQSGIAPVQQKTYYLVVDVAQSAATALGQFKNPKNQSSLDVSFQTFKTHHKQSRKELQGLRTILSRYTDDFNALNSLQSKKGQTTVNSLSSLGQTQSMPFYPDPAYQESFQQSSARFSQMNGNLINLLT